MIGLSEIIEYVNIFLENLSTFDEKYNGNLAENSIIIQELKNSDQSPILLSAFNQGDLFINIAADQLFAITKVLIEPISSYAPWACLRALLEASALGAWILSPNIDATIRIKRSLALRYESFDQRKKFISSINRVDPIINDTNQKIDKLEDKAKSLGFKELMDKNGKRYGVGQKMPSITDLIKSELDEESNYRLYSGIIHAHFWAIRSLSLRVLNKDIFIFDKNTKGIPISMLENHFPIENIYHIVRVAIKNISKPIWYKYCLYGWDKELLISNTKKVCDQFQINIDWMN